MERVRPYLPVLIGLGILLVVALPCLLVYQFFGFGAQQVRQLADSVNTQVANVLHPTPTIIPDPITIVHEVRSLARLETIQYSVEKIIVAESGQGPFGFLFGDRLLFVAHGTVIAGVDLEKLTPDDLRTENGVLFVNMPEAEVFIASLDNDKSYIYDRETGLFTRGNQLLETEARQAAEQEILNAALEDGILEQAQINAESYLLRLLLNLGFPDVIFENGG
ncbi:MAG: DUF4230 domain-containing protein [Anaerolineales bacterium]